MYLIDNSTKVSTKPTKAPAGLFGYFTNDGPGTIVDADFLNGISDELKNIVEAAGLTLDKEDDSQVLQAIELLINDTLTDVNGNLSVDGTTTLNSTTTLNGSTIIDGTLTLNNSVWANQGIITVNPSIGTNNNQVTTNYALNRAVANGGYSKTIVKTAKNALGGCIVINNKVFLSGLATAYIGKNGSHSIRRNFTEVPFNNAHLIPSGTTITQVAYTGMNLYVVLSNGWVYSWGWNTYGQLGHGDTTHRYVLNRIEYFVTNSLSVTNVWAKRWNHSDDETFCYVFFKTSNGNTYSCGYNSEGMLGLGNTTNQSTPTRVTALQDVTLMSLGGGAGGHGLAVCSASPKSVYAWGYNASGQCGNGTTTNITTPVITYTHATDNIQQVEAASSNYFNGSSWTSAIGRSYILVGGTIKSVGENTVGPALGIGNTTNQSSWQNVPTLTGITKIEVNAGYYGAVYALNATTGVLYACGSNGYGELGNGNTTNQSSFVTSIASGCVDVYACGFSSYNSTFAKLSDGRLVGCGYNGNGVLGTGLATFPTTISSWVDIPRPVGNIVDFDAVYDLSARNDGMLLVQMDDGGLYTCGLNVNNALSINDDAMGYITDTLTPVQLIYK